MNKITGAAISALTILVFSLPVFAQSLQLPDAGTNYKSKIRRQLAATEIEITWNAPGVKGREGKIWGTDVAYYGYEVLGFGSYMKSPWRAGADESTTISFSTDVLINGKRLPAGKYGFFIAVYPDSCVLIFNKNTKGWGSYFYNSSLDVLHVTTRQEKDLPQSKERLEYNFSKQTANTIVISLDWEKWRIPFTVETDVVKTGLASIQAQMSGALGFDPLSLESAAAWCLRNDINYEQALVWITSATDPNLGGVKTFNALSTRSGLLKKMGRNTEADSVMQAGISIATAVELHSYGRSLISENKAKEALAIFELNHKRNKGAWPTEAGLMRGYSATGDLKKALEHAKTALAQAPNPESKRALEDAIKKLTEGKAL